MLTTKFFRSRFRVPALLAAALLLGTSVAQADPLKICFMYSNPIGVSGWTYQQEQARQKIESDLGDKVETKYVENVAAGPDATRVIRNFVRDDCKVIFTPSFGFMQPTLKVAKNAPEDVIFLNGTGYKTRPNVGTYNARYREVRYLEGIIAGAMTKSNNIGYIGAYPIPEVIRGINAFTLGAQSVNPDAVVNLIWVNDWRNPGKERDAANALIEQGADVLTYATSGLATVKMAEQRGIYTLGYYSNMREFGPKTNLASVVMHWGDYYVKLVKQILADDWKSENTILGLKDGVIGLGPLNPAIPDDVVKQVNQAKQQIIDGELDIFAGPIVDRKGKTRVPEGEVPSQKEVDYMDYLVKGIDGLLPD